MGEYSLMQWTNPKVSLRAYYKNKNSWDPVYRESILFSLERKGLELGGAALSIGGLNVSAQWKSQAMTFKAICLTVAAAGCVLVQGFCPRDLKDDQELFFTSFTWYEKKSQVEQFVSFQRAFNSQYEEKKNSIILFVSLNLSYNYTQHPHDNSHLQQMFQRQESSLLKNKHIVASCISFAMCSTTS